MGQRTDDKFGIEMTLTNRGCDDNDNGNGDGDGDRIRFSRDRKVGSNDQTNRTESKKLNRRNKSKEKATRNSESGCSYSHVWADVLLSNSWKNLLNSEDQDEDEVEDEVEDGIVNIDDANADEDKSNEKINKLTIENIAINTTIAYEQFIIIFFFFFLAGVTCVKNIR